MNKRTLENLIAAGAFDVFGAAREQIIAGISRLVGHANRMADNAAIGMSDMFGSDATAQEVQLPLAQTWLPSEKLNREFQALGFYFSAHPLDEYEALLKKMRVQSWMDFERAVKNGSTAGRLAGTVTQRQERKTKKGNRMAIVQLSDPSGQYEVVAFSETLSHYRDILEVGNSVILLVSADERPEGVSARIQSVTPLDEAAGKLQKSLRIFVRDESPIASIASHLVKPGEGEVSIVVLENDGEKEIEVKLGGRKALSPPLASAMKAIPGVVDVELV
jgi:DNA polymerase-3 subunit alpha